MSYEQPVSCLAAAASASSSAPATTVPVARACDAKPLRARGRLRGALPGAGLALLASAMLVPGLAAADTLDTVRERGVVVCGVNENLPGFSRANSLGVWSGLDIDLCRAVASAVFGDPEAAKFVPVSATERFEELAAGTYDVLARHTTWTLSRNAIHGEFVGVNYYDGQGFMVKNRSGIRSALELDNRPICLSRGTTTELNAIDFFAVGNLRYRPEYFEGANEAARAYLAGECDALTTDRSGLAAQRAGFEQPEAHQVLPEVISKEPLGPVVRAGDARWANIVRWTLACMINAEEMGLTQANVRQRNAVRTPAARRLVGDEEDLGALLGLAPRWCAQVIRDVGNYAESYERNVGPDTPLALERGVNRLWTDGGLLYAPPVR